jgi:hypothetical protein
MSAPSPIATVVRTVQKCREGPTADISQRENDVCDRPITETKMAANCGSKPPPVEVVLTSPE